MNKMTIINNINILIIENKIIASGYKKVNKS